MHTENTAVSEETAEMNLSDETEEISETAETAPTEESDTAESVGEEQTEVTETEPVFNESENEVSLQEISEMLDNTRVSVEQELQEISGKLNTVETRVNSLRKLADMHEAIETELNTQINQYKDNFYRRIVSPILMEIFDLQEDMCQERSSYEDDSENILDEYIDSITSILRHYGVKVQFVKEGDVYDSAVHKPLRAVQTDDKSLDMTICKVKKRTIHYIDDKIVERAGVFVYQYKEQKNEETDNNSHS